MITFFLLAVGFLQTAPAYAETDCRGNPLSSLRIQVLAIKDALKTTPRAQEGCGLDEKDGAFRGSEGQLIFYTFGEHHDPDSLKLLMVLSDPKSPLKEHFQGFVNVVKESAADVLANQQARLDQIRKQMAQHTVKWVALESSTSTSETEKDELGFTRQQRFESLQSNLEGAGVPQSDIQQMLLLMEGPVGYIFRSDPNLRRKIILQPIEDQRYFQEAADMSQDLEMKIQKLRNLVPSSLSQAQFAQILTAFNGASANYELIADSEMTRLAAFSKEKSISDQITSVLQGANIYYGNNQTREWKVIESLRSLKGDGIFQFGDAHKKGLLQKWKDSCLLTSH